MEEENFHACEMILFEKVEEGLRDLEPDEMQFEKVEGDYFEDGLEGVADVVHDLMEEENFDV